MMAETGTEVQRPPQPLASQPQRMETRNAFNLVKYQLYYATFGLSCNKTVKQMVHDYTTPYTTTGWCGRARAAAAGSAAVAAAGTVAVAGTVAAAVGMAAAAGTAARVAAARVGVG